MAQSSPQARQDAPWHRFGMGLSALCLLHCLALPWLLASLPAAMLAALPEAVRDHEWFHAALIAPVLLVSGTVLLRAAPGRLRTTLVLAAFAALIGALFAASEAGEQALTVIGAALLMAAHWQRLRQRHRH
ncbi:MAG: MerC domain-containing protein [Erythrobacteraceae bacterium]|nr:MerC domain-containing protein [Erythrobacteraceae bacterium]